MEIRMSVIIRTWFLSNEKTFLAFSCPLLLKRENVHMQTAANDCRLLTGFVMASCVGHNFVRLIFDRATEKWQAFTYHMTTSYYVYGVHTLLTFLSLNFSTRYWYVPSIPAIVDSSILDNSVTPLCFGIILYGNFFIFEIPEVKTENDSYRFRNYYNLSFVKVICKDQVY